MLVKPFSITAGAALIVASTAIGLMVADREVPLDMMNVEILTPVVKPGERFERRITVMQRRKCYVYSQRALFDSKDHRWLLDPIELPVGVPSANRKKEASYVVSVMMPSGIAPGPARLVIDTVYRCNLLHWLWPVVAPQQTITFEIAGK